MEKTCREGGVDARGESETRGGKIRGTKKKKKEEKRKRETGRIAGFNTCTTDATLKEVRRPSKLTILGCSPR